MDALPHRMLVTHAAPESFAPLTRAILAKLGYAILDSEEFSAQADEYDRPDLLVVDERRLGEVPEDGGPPVPLVVLTGRHGVTGADPRIAGALRRPAGLHELYRLLQQILEDAPRSAPRVPTHLPVLCTQEGRRWKGAILSLSENGGLLRSPEPLPLGSRLALRIELPRAPLQLEAEVGYQLVPDVGLIFSSTLPAERAALSGYVAEALASL